MRVLVLGASGQIGRAVARRLLDHGAEVDAVTRDGRTLPAEIAGARHLDPEPRSALIAGGRYHAVFDPIAYTAADAADLLAHPDAAGAYCVISTASVYADDEGRGFESGDSFPRYPDPIPEDQPRVPPGPGYSAGKVAMEDVLLASSAPVAILRPGAIHGIGALHPREWYFVKRVLDGRVHLPLEDGGNSVFATSSVAGIAGLAHLCMGRAVRGAFNVADPVAPTVREIAEAVAAVMGHRFAITDAAEGVGHTPWSVPNPLRLTCAKARALGWDGGPDFAANLPPYIDWMVTQAADWRRSFPVFAGYRNDPFDYNAEDAVRA